MKRNPYYALYSIEGTYYLLPFGQGIAEHARGIEINETGAFLWNTLEAVSDKNALLEELIQHYQADENETTLLADDMKQFLFLLTSLGIIIEDWKTPARNNPFVMHLMIGPLYLMLTGENDIFPESFHAYRTESSATPDMTIELRTDTVISDENGTLLIQNNELCVWEQTDRYHLLFPDAAEITDAYLSKDGTYACICHKKIYTKQLTEELLHAIRLLYLYTAGLHNCHALHSASILYKEQAWLFSGHSGMGKSTHTELWNKLFHTPLLNGDLNLLAFKNGIPVIYGIPWCGTSKISDSGCYPLGGIILLARGEKDVCEKLSPDKKTLLISQRLISPAWDAPMLQKNIDAAQKLSKKIPVCRLKCTKNDSAAYTVKKWIDNSFTF